MAEPLSCIVSATALLNYAVHMSGDLRSLLSSLKNAPDLIIALSNEIADITVVLSRVSEVARMEGDISSSQTDHFIALLDSHLDQAKSILEDLNNLSKTLQGTKPSLRRLKWVLKSSNAAELKVKLREVRFRINEILLAYNTYV